MPKMWLVIRLHQTLIMIAYNVQRLKIEVGLKMEFWNDVRSCWMNVKQHVLKINKVKYEADDPMSRNE